METVYLLVVDWSIRSGEHGYDTWIFDDIEKAKAEMTNQVKEARCDLDGEGYVEDNYVEGDMAFSRYADGDWTGEHIDITIFEKDVIE